MRRRQPRIPQRRPIFLGCEGQSEVGYGTLLARVVEELRDVHVHLHVQLLQPGAGNPPALVTRASQLIREIERKRTAFAVKAVLLDRGDDQRNRDAAAAAQQAGIDHLIWQAPDHEALLLRHLPGCEHRQPPRGQSLAELRREWREYEKGMSAQALARRIAMDDVRRACGVEEHLRAFLRAIGAI